MSLCMGWWPRALGLCGKSMQVEAHSHTDLQKLGKAGLKRGGGARPGLKACGGPAGSGCWCGVGGWGGGGAGRPVSCAATEGLPLLPGDFGCCTGVETKAGEGTRWAAEAQASGAGVGRGAEVWLPSQTPQAARPVPAGPDRGP